MDVVYFENNHTNRLIYIMTHMETQQNVINSRDWITIAPLISVTSVTSVK